MGRAAGLALAAALATGTAAAQTRASLDAGVSQVEYQDFLPSAAFSLTPAFAYATKDWGFGGRATWLQFESGNSSIQGQLSTSLFFSAGEGTVAELGAELGGSRYEDFATFSRVLGRARLRVRGSGGASGWGEVTLGAATFDSQGDAVLALAGGARFDRRQVTFSLGGAVTFVGDVVYQDLEGGIRYARPGGVRADAVVSLRAGNYGGQVGPFFEAALELPLTRYLAVVLGGGRFPADGVRGTVAGRYVSAGLRLTPPARRPSLATLAARNDSLAGDASVAAILIEVRRGRGEACTLVFRASSAVEVMGDFTDWLPTALEPAGRDRWSITLPISPGRHRLNVRLAGGFWGVPAGTRPVEDDFLGMVGAVVIP